MAKTSSKPVTKVDPKDARPKTVDLSEPRARVVLEVPRHMKRPAKHGVYLTRRKNGSYYVEPDSYPGAPYEAKDWDAVLAGLPH